jgi:spore maturation protein CgeB
MTTVTSSRPRRIIYGLSHTPGLALPGDLLPWQRQLAEAGIQLDFFVLTLDAPGPPLTWSQLDRRWRRGDRNLLAMYERLALACAGYDLFINGAGINLHPDFVRQLPIMAAYACYDDPESSHLLSRPVAAAYDFALVGNLAEVSTYRSWGVRHAFFWPLGFFPQDVDPTLTKAAILGEERDLGVVLLCERESPWRRERLDRLAAAFPDGFYRGRGWPGGYLAEAERISVSRRTRICPNLHNSTGPVNLRTFSAPANGVLLVGDNPGHLNQLYRLYEEAVGFVSIDEAIDRCRYFLAHEDERRRIAAAGWERAWRDYNQVARFRLLDGFLAQVQPSVRPEPTSALAVICDQRRATRITRAVDQFVTPFLKSGRHLKRTLRCLRGRA